MAVLAEHNPEDAYKDDYHGHPNYIVTWLILIAALAISMVPGVLVPATTTLIAGVFIVAVIKAMFVLGNFMHIRYEPKLLWGLVGFALFVFAAFFWGVLPDVNAWFEHGATYKDSSGNVVNNPYGRGEYTHYTVQRIKEREIGETVVVQGKEGTFTHGEDAIALKGPEFAALIHAAPKKLLDLVAKTDPASQKYLNPVEVQALGKEELAKHSHH